jgi:hypothetical protein
MSEGLRLPATGAAVHFVGTYEDSFARRGGEWRFARRTYRPRYEEDVAPPARRFGETPTSTPSASRGIRE